MDRFTTRARTCNALLLLAFAVISASCSDSTGPDYEYLGVHQVSVAQVQMPSLAVTGDTLSVLMLGGTTTPSGCLSLSRVDATRDSSCVELTVWAEVRRWIGSGPPPPCGTVDAQYDALPPFSPGYFRVVISQPDGSVLADSVLVES
jgi:hypothetical protein